MNRVRIPMLTMSMMTPVERARGRFMRAPDHPGEGDDLDESDSNEDNQGGNSSESETSKDGEDNTSQPEGLDGFWNKKPAEESSSDSDEATKEASKALGQELGGLIQNFKAPEAFNKEIADAIADGDLTKINESMATRDQAILKQSMMLSAKLFGGVIDKLSKDFDSRIQKALGNKDNEIALETHFPLAKDPTMRPMVQRVWDQALVNADGNREKAITLTKGMLKAFGSKTSLREPPEDPTAGIGTSASRALVESLLERGQ